MLNILALDTSTPRAAIALATAAGAVHVARPDPEVRHGRNLVLCLRELLGQAGLAVGAIEVFAVGLGPGSYTGLRVGLTAAKVLAYAAGRPLVGFDSLEAIARNAPEEALRVAVVADAQRGDVYAADFAREAPGGPLVRRSPTRIEPLESWAARLEAETVVLGPGVELPRVLDALPVTVCPLLAGDPAHWPEGRKLIGLARDLWQSGRRDDPWFLEPLYLRRSAAEDLWERQAPRTRGTIMITNQPVATDQSRTKSAYGLQWNRFRILRPEEDRATFRNRTGLDTADLGGVRVLDAGCGMGRYLRIAAEAGAALAVGLDLSAAVAAARALTADLPGVALVRGDLLRPPLLPGSFDHVYALGVLDHTPDPRAAFLALARLLKPGGRIAIWVYPRERPALERIMRYVQRAFSTRLPLGLLMALSRLSAPIGGLKRRLMASPNRLIARAGVALNVLTIGVSMHPDPEVRVCDTLDWYAPKYLSRHDPGEVRGWFAAAGLVDVVDLAQGQTYYHAGQGNGVNLAGRRPVRPSP